MNPFVVIIETSVIATSPANDKFSVATLILSF